MDFTAVGSDARILKIDLERSVEEQLRTVFAYTKRLDELREHVAGFESRVEKQVAHRLAFPRLCCPSMIPASGQLIRRQQKADVYQMKSRGVSNAQTPR